MTSFFDNPELLKKTNSVSLHDVLDDRIQIDNVLEATALDSSYAGKLKNLGLLYAAGRTLKKDPQRAFNLFKRAAALGEPDAAFYVAMALREGFGTSQNLNESFAWLRTAASRNQKEAIFELGQAFEKAWGCEADLEEAKALYEKSASMGDKNAQKRLVELAVIDPSEFSGAFKWIEAANDNQLPDFILAQAKNLIETNPNNLGVALSLLEKAVILEDTDCMAYLAAFWKEGRFCPSDMVAAIVYAHMAASRGNYLCEEWLDKWRETVSEQELMEASEVASAANPKEIVQILAKRRLC